MLICVASPREGDLGISFFAFNLAHSAMTKVGDDKGKPHGRGVRSR